MTTRLLAVLLLLALAACKKHTEYSGTVLSSADGKPVAGVQVRLFFNYGAGGGQTKISAEDEMTTDETGKYFVSCEVKQYDGGFLRVIKDESFMRFSKPVDAGDCETLDITIHPIDAWLGLEVENTRDSAVMCYAAITGQVYNGLGEAFPGGIGPYEIPAHSSWYIGTQKVPGGHPLDVFWIDRKVQSLQVSANRTPVFCPRNDTTVVKVVF